MIREQVRLLAAEQYVRVSLIKDERRVAKKLINSTLKALVTEIAEEVIQ